MPSIDLHTHSKWSDGTGTPADVVRRAHAAGVKLLALSDHDTTGGWPEAKAAADGLGLDLRPAVEINTIDDHVHLLGYRIDPEHPVLQERLSDFRDRRRRRIGAIIDRLNQKGLDLDLEEIEAVSGPALGRPHVADALRRQGVVGSRREAFERFLVRGKPGFVDPMGPTIEEGMAAIHAAGGFCVLAHPGRLRGGTERLEAWVQMGLQGIEAYYQSHTASLRLELLDLAKRYGLLPTGGSDHHGDHSGREGIGGVDVPEELFRTLQERL